MKISEMTNDQATEVLARISVPMSNLLEDKDFVELVDEVSKGVTDNAAAFVARIIPKAASFCLKSPKDDLYEIVGALTFKPAKAVGNMNFLATVKELRESIDEDFIGFFRSSGNATATPGEQ